MIKKNKFIIKIYRLIIGLITLWSPVVASKIRYRISMGKKLDLDNPRGFNEKMMWLNLYWQDPLKTKCADKYLVREYVKEKGCEEILNPIYGVYKTPEEINWDILPNKFVLKSTYGSGRNIICTDKNKLDIKKTNKILKKWLSPKLLNTTAQMHYSQKTNVIICEKYIETPQGKGLIDYKFYCFNGEPKIILAIEGRDNNSEIKKMFYDLNWTPLKQYINPKYAGEEIERPSQLKKMIEYARILSGDFPFVRVDLYNVENQVIFGELTFTPAACLSKTHNQKGDEFFGSLLDISEYK